MHLKKSEKSFKMVVKSWAALGMVFFQFRMFVKSSPGRKKAKPILKNSYMEIVILCWDRYTVCRKSSETYLCKNICLIINQVKSKNISKNSY